MIGALFLLLFGKLQDTAWAGNSRAWHWACAYAALNLLMSLGGLSGAGIVIGGMMLFLYAWGYFALLRRLSDSLGLWLLTYLCGAALPLVFAFMLIE